MNYKINCNGLDNIENVRKVYSQSYDNSFWLTKVMLKCWLNHSESRNKNNNSPFTFDNYINHQDELGYIEQINLNIIDVSDLGTKEHVINMIKKRL